MDNESNYTIRKKEKDEKLTTPKVPYDYDDFGLVGVCPNCKSVVTPDTPYCPQCGQFLDWDKF